MDPITFIPPGTSFDRSTVINWQTLGGGHTPRPAGWYAGLIGSGIVGVLLSAYFGNFLFALLVFLASLVLALFSTRGPDPVRYSLSARGLRIDDRLFSFQNLESFTVHEDDPPTLVIHSKRAFMPVITIPLPPETTADIRHFLLFYLIEEDHEIPYSDQFTRALGM